MYEERTCDNKEGARNELSKCVIFWHLHSMVSFLIYAYFKWFLLKMGEIYHQHHCTSLDEHSYLAIVQFRGGYCGLRQWKIPCSLECRHCYPGGSSLYCEYFFSTSHWLTRVQSKRSWSVSIDRKANTEETRATHVANIEFVYTRYIFCERVSRYFLHYGTDLRFPTTWNMAKYLRSPSADD